MKGPVLLAAATLTSVALVLAQDSAPPQVTFRAGVDVVEVEVSVLDKNRIPVRNLQPSDFQVFEDGQPRPVIAFTPVELKPRELPTAPWMVEAASDVQSNTFPREGRLITIVFDRSIRAEHGEIARQVAHAAVDQLRPGDLAAVVYTGRGMPQNFTDDRARLRAAILQPFANLPAGDSGSSGECFCNACSIESVANIAEAVQDVRQRRKVVLYIGGNFPVQSMGGCGGALEGPRRRAMRAAEVGNLTIYTFDTVGLETLFPGADSSGPIRMRSNTARRNNLSLLPDFTGGRAVLDNRPAMTVTEVLRESESYYVLGFQPTHADGRYHRVQVKVPGRDVRLLSRRGYYAAGAPSRPEPPAVDGVSSRLRTAISGIWPRTAIPLVISTIPMATSGLVSGTVAVVIGVRQEVVQNGGAAIPASVGRAAPVHVLVGAFDRNGRSLAEQRQTIEIAPPPDGPRPFEYEIVSRLQLPPGRYEIRAALEDTALDEVGSVYAYVDVPNYAQSPVAMSGILLEQAPSRAPSVGIRFDDLVPVVPTAGREFLRGDRVTMFAKSYQGVTRAVMPGYATIEILDTEGRRVFQREQRVLTSDFGANRALDMLMDLPMAQLSPGPHLLRVEMRHGNATAAREVRFQVQ